MLLLQHTKGKVRTKPITALKSLPPGLARQGSDARIAYLELGNLLHFQGVGVGGVGQRALAGSFFLDRPCGGGLLRFGAFLASRRRSGRGCGGRGGGFRGRFRFRHFCF